MSAAKPQNAAVWFEIPAADFERAVGFYEKVFDTRLKREKFGPADMAVFPAAEKGVAGAVVAGQGYKPTATRANELRVIPGIGPSIAGDLNGIGITRVAQLSRADPQKLYDRVCEATGTKQDRCLLYVFRCAVYYASRPVHEAEKLKWWNWKDNP